MIPVNKINGFNGETVSKVKGKKPNKKPEKKRSEVGVQKRKKYSEESVQKALQAIRNGMSKKLASKTYQVPRSTLQFKSKFPNKKSRPGPSTALTTSEELCLKNWLIDCSKKGFPKRKDDLVASVADFFKKNDRQNPFKDGIPGDKWYKLFLARHPDIAIRTPEAVTASSATVAEGDIRHWFDDIEQYIIENNLTDILKDPKRIYNSDETNFLLCPKSGVVLAAKEEKNVYEIDNAPAKTSLTVLFTFGADGSVTPPLVIFPLKRLPSELRSKIPSDWGIGLSDNGWMKSDIFKSYIENVLHPHLSKKGIQFPIILYVDGHKTHLTYEVSELCSKLSIVLIALYPNCTRILQPADVSAFKPLKSGWQKTVLAWRRNHPSQALTKQEFVPLLKNTIDESINPSIIINGFRVTGLYPFNKNAVDYTKCLGKRKNNAQEENEDIKQIDIHEHKMTFIDFKRIINESKLRMLEKGEDVDEDLKKVYQFLTRKSEHEPQNIVDNIEELVQNPSVTNFEYFDINSMNITIADNVDNEIVIEEIQKYTLEDTDIQDFEPHVLEITHKAQIHTDSNKEKIELNKDNLPKPKTTINYDIIEVVSVIDNPPFSCPNIDTLKPVKLDDILVLPKTPERKGVRNHTKTPFVLTSAAWQELETKKRREKEEKQEGIRKRKEERERKKLEKSKPKKESNNSKPKKGTRKHITNSNTKILQRNSSETTQSKNTFISDKNNDLDEPQSTNLGVMSDTDNEHSYEQEIIITNRRPSKAYTTEELEKLLSEMEE